MNVDAQTEYLKKRIESLQLAVETQDALLAGDKDLATKKNDDYNVSDKKAASLAKALPLSLEPAVNAAYEPQISAGKTEYAAAREQVIASDSLIRDYTAQ